MDTLQTHTYQANEPAGGERYSEDYKMTHKKKKKWQALERVDCFFFY